MSKSVKKPSPKKQRADKYEEKVIFNGTFKDMIKISTTGAGAKKATHNKTENVKNKPKKNNIDVRN